MRWEERVSINFTENTKIFWKVNSVKRTTEQWGDSDKIG